MKKPLAILLAFFIVFAPVYSNAVLPALAASVASATRVLVGATIKKVSPAALVNANKAAIGICKSNPSTCKALGLGVGGILGAIAGDGWNIEITNNDVTNIDVDIYKIPPNEQCELQVGFGVDHLSQSSHKIERLAALTAENSVDVPHQVLAHATNSATYTTEISNIKKSEAAYKLPEWKLVGTILLPYILKKGSQVIVPKFLAGDSTYVRCAPYPTNKTYITNYELNEYITNNTTNNDIDIKDIYNFDFSQYNINIGGDTYNGTTINNDLSKSDPSEADKKVSPDLKKKLDDKTISLDDVNDQNCTKNEAGEYDKCGDKTDPTDPTDPEEPTDPEPEPPPIECDANGFYKKVCDWMDWTQKPHDKPDSGNVDIIDKSEGLNIDQNRIDFTNQCPAPTPINTSVGGFPVSTELNYQPLCDFFEMLNPFVIGMGGISSALIIAGGARRG